MSLNDNIFYFLHSFANRSATLDQVIILTADILPYLILVSLGFFYFVIADPDNFYDFSSFLKTHAKEILGVFFSLLVTTFAVYGLKAAFAIPRPFDSLPEVLSLLPETGYAFPSAHSAFFMALAVSVLPFHKKFGYALVFLAFMIGIARIVAGVHYPIDILGGFVIGAAISYAVAYFYKSV